MTTRTEIFDELVQELEAQLHISMAWEADAVKVGPDELAVAKENTERLGALLARARGL